MMTINDNYPFYLYVEWLEIYSKWWKWWEDLIDIFWYSKIKEED